MTDPTQATPATQGQTRDFSIPDSVRAQFPELIALISGSESMNDDERQYWFDLLPVMTPDQRENLSSILKNEREQLAAIDAKYAPPAPAASPAELAAARKANREELRSKEQSDQTQEQTSEEDLLRKIDEL